MNDLLKLIFHLKNNGFVPYTGYIEAVLVSWPNFNVSSSQNVSAKLTPKQKS